jgi:primosomal protein N' (replication factor Y) (superfamily II helicase)
MRKRISTHGLPTVKLVDMRGRGEDEEVLSQETLEALWERCEKKQQSILFLNRRGFATTLSCNKCGHVLTCSHCSVAMVFHRKQNQLVCHHCDSRTPMPDNCPACNEHFIRQRGFGTERVVHEIEKKLPNARIIRIDRDTTTKKGDHDRLLTPFRNGEADILVGTQMIAKGLDFPNVTLVGVINADYSLSLPDFRASERTFFLLTQVAGRSGRGEHAGEVLIQTYCPDHYSVQLALKQDYDAFFEKEIRYRRLIAFPPFSRLVLWRIEAANEDVARGKSWELYNILCEGLKTQSGITLLPPVEAPLYRLRDYYRWQVALKSRDHRAFRPLLTSTALQKFMSQRRQDLRIVQDVDPFDML